MNYNFCRQHPLGLNSIFTKHNKGNNLLTLTAGNLARILLRCFVSSSKSMNLKETVVTAPAADIPHALSMASSAPGPYRLRVSPSSSAR